MDTLFKQFHTEVKAVAESRSIKFLISTDSVDRDGDSISPKGWQLDNYLKSPVVLWSHDYTQPPIAKATDVKMTDNGLSATAEFPAKGIYPLADTVYELLKGGFLSASSVGFRPIEAEKAADREKGFNYSKQELLEFSVVPVPANPEALVQLGAKPSHKGLMKPVVEWSEKFLGEYYGERGVWVPASQVEKAFEVITKSGALDKPPTQSGRLIKTPATEEMDMSGATSTETAAEEQAEGECLMPKNEDSIEITVSAPDMLELTDEIVDIDNGQLAALVESACRSAIAKAAHEGAQRAIDYARGRVV